MHLCIRHEQTIDEMKQELAVISEVSICDVQRFAGWLRTDAELKFTHADII